MKRTLFCLAAFLLAGALCCACTRAPANGQGPSSSLSSSPPPSSSADASGSRGDGPFSLTQTQVQPDPGLELGTIAGTPSALYYSLHQTVPMGTMDLMSQVFRLDESTGQAALLWEIGGDGEHSHQFSELTALDGALFWTLAQDTRVVLQRLDLDDGSVTDLVQWSRDQLEGDILLTGQGDWLVWTEAAEGKCTLYAYNDASGARFAVDDVAPLARYPVHDGVVAFAREAAGTWSLFLYDLEAREETQLAVLAPGETVTRLEGSREWVVYALGDDEAFYCHSPADGQTRALDGLAGQDLSIFSLHLLGSWLMINDRSSGEILALSLTDGAWAHPTQELPGSHTFVLGACAGENSLIALDGTSILRLIRNP